MEMKIFCLESQYVYASHEEIQKVKKEGRYQEYEAKGLIVHEIL